MHKYLSLYKKASLYETMLGCSIEAKILTSLRALALSQFDKECIETFFNAYSY